MLFLQPPPVELRVLLSWPWLEIAGLIVAAVALIVALRANSHAKHANTVAEVANSIAERSTRASKLPSVEDLYAQLRQLVPRLRARPHLMIEELDSVAGRARIVARESLGPPFDHLRAALQQIPARDGHLNEYGDDTATNRPVPDEEWMAVQESIDSLLEAFEDFINR